MYKTQELSQKQEITVAPNITLKYKKKPHLQVYKCPYMDCDAIFFSQDDRDQHLIAVHNELPPSVMKGISIEIPSGKLFSRRDIALLRFNHTKQALSKYAALAGASFRAARAPRAKLKKPKPTQTNTAKVPLVATSEVQPIATRQEPAPAPSLSLWHRISKIFKKG
ncbi:MAG: hypothetical protein QXD11_03075 [Candidatus Micrarchaeaceae archaeon]